MLFAIQPGIHVFSTKNIHCSKCLDLNMKGTLSIAAYK